MSAVGKVLVVWCLLSTFVMIAASSDNEVNLKLEIYDSGQCFPTVESLRTYGMRSLLECAVLCRATTGCIGFTYDTAMSGMCQMGLDYDLESCSVEKRTFAIKLPCNPTNGEIYNNVSDSCILVNKVQATWENAKANCETAYGGRLFEIATAEIGTWFSNLIDEHQGDWTLQYWIGLRDIGGWRWRGSNRALGYSMWGANQPNSVSEECVAMKGSQKNWHDYNCRGDMYSICEIQL